jgi:isocitrate dehydrogenase kinase/phosphatase
MNSNTMTRPVSAAVTAIDGAYRKYERGFEEITRRARGRFEHRDWSGTQSDATERLALYKAHVDGAVTDVHDILEDAVMERTVWAAMKSEHAKRTTGFPDAELAETFFNSVTRRVFSTVGVDPAIEYLERPEATPRNLSEPEIYRTFTVDRID